MGQITLPTTYADGVVPTAAQFNGNEQAIVTEVNGGLDNSNIASDAAIDATKIANTAATLSGNETFTGTKTFYKTAQTLVTATDGSTVTFNLANGQIQTVTLGGNRTLALSNVTTGQSFILKIKQDATGSRTVTWFSGISWPYGITPVLTSTATKTDVFGFICTGSNTYDGFILGQSL